MLGTHNSLSYLPVKQWWLKPFFWVARCQSLDIEQQYEMGVRYFDIRVRFPKGMTDWRQAVTAHGLITYKGWVTRFLYKIAMFDDPCIVRLFFENSKKQSDFEDSWARRFTDEVRNRYPEITFVEGGSRYRWNPTIGEHPACRVCYAEYWKRKFCIPFPWLWSKRNNKKVRKSMGQAAPGVIDIYDFVQI